MQLTYAGLTLGDDAGGKRVSDYLPDFSVLTSRAQFVQGQRQRSFARKNRGREISFRVHREESSAADAIALSHTHPETLPDTGTLRITQGDRTFEGTATLERCSPRDILGVSLAFEYVFFVGLLVEVDGAEGDTLRDVVFADGETTAGTVTGGAPGLIYEGDLDTVSDN